MRNIPNISFKSEDNNNDFEILNLSKLFARLHTIKDHNPTLPHRISFFALLIVTKGFGKHLIDMKEYNLTKGTVLKIAKGQIHAFQKNATYKGFLIVFTEDFVLNYFSKSSLIIISNFYNYHITQPVTIDKKENRIFLHQLKKELEAENKYAQKNIIAAILNLYLLRLEQKNKTLQNQDTQTKNYDTFINFKNLVESKYHKTRNVKDYADLMFTSSKFLNLVVKEFTFNTAKNFIDNYVLLEAKRDLISSNKSIKEVSYHIGFNEVTNFTKFFKKKTNTTPKEFRAKQTYLL